MKHKTHNHKIKSLKTRLYEIEKLLDKMSRQSRRQVKCLLRCWVDWWANIMVKEKPKLKTYKIKGKTYYLKKRKNKKGEHYANRRKKEVRLHKSG